MRASERERERERERGREREGERERERASERKGESDKEGCDASGDSIVTACFDTDCIDHHGRENMAAMLVFDPT